MVKGVSDRTVIILLVFAFLFVVGGTLIIYDSVNDFKESKVQLSGSGSATGMVTLEVVEDYYELEEISNENLE